MSARGLITALAVTVIAACGGADPAPDPILVGVYRNVGTCVEIVAGGDTIAPEILTAAAIEQCPAAPPSSNTVRPGDTITLVIDYGDDVEFSDGTTVTAPTITPALNGAATTLALTPGPLNVTGRAVFRPTFQVPLQPPGTVLSLAVQASADFKRLEPITLVIVDTDVRVLVDACADPSACAIAASSRTVDVRISTSGRTPQNAVLHSVVDGVEQPTQMVMINRPIDGNRIEGVAARIPVPLAAAGARWELYAEVGSSRGAHGAIELTGLPLEVRIEECPATSGLCTLFAGAQTASVHVRVGGTREQTIALRQIVNGVPQDATRPATVRQSDGEMLDALVFIDVPAAVRGTRWDLRAELGPFGATQAPAITIDPPRPAVDVAQCSAGGPCTLPGGVVKVNVVATAEGTRPQTIVVTSRIDGVVQATPLTTIAAVRESDGVVRGSKLVDVPSARTGARWDLIATLGSEAAERMITLRAPLIGVTIEGPDPLRNGVGSAIARVTVEGTREHQLQLASIVDGVQQTGSTQIQVNQNEGTQFSGFAPVPVPTSGTRWVLAVTLGDVTMRSPERTLIPPTIRTRLSCDPCSPVAGTNATFLVEAPLGLRDRTTTVTVRRQDGTFVLQNAAVTLDQIDNVAQTITGAISFQVPNAAGQTITIDATAGGYRATTLQLTINPP